VLHALQPLSYLPGPHQTGNSAQWKLKSSDDLLGLKVADIACGSGAFLVAAARYLADRVVEAWINEDPANFHRKDLYRRAIRQVVANCLYGADINDMAVEMCKLSLWLVSLDRDLPFSFVDDKVFLGNSLLGITNLDQLRKLHIHPKSVPSSEMFDIFDVDIDIIIRKAIALRERLATEIDEDDPGRSSTAKHRQLRELGEVTASLRAIADGVIAAGLSLGGKPGKSLDEAFGNLREAVKRAHPGPRDGESNSKWLDTIIDHGLSPTIQTDYERWQPLHWVLEAPDVIVGQGGFDAVIGNPPFLGGKKLSGAVGVDVRDWLVYQIAGGAKGHADLVAYFFLRAFELTKSTGTLGLIATNTVAQGDSREVGLDQMADRGFSITAAIQSRSWPASSANLEFAAVWGARGHLADDIPRYVEGVPVARISTLLEAEGRASGTPRVLTENSGVAFIGCFTMGMGFVVDASEAQNWIAADQKNADVLRPFVNGDDLNSRPDASASRWVIDFNVRGESEAAQFALPFAHVEREVKPERASKSPAVRDSPWWQFFRTRPNLRKAITGMNEVLVLNRHSVTVMPVRVRTGQIFSDATVVFAVDSYFDQALLSSSAHQLWAVMYGSTLGHNTVRYTPSDVFGTFPRPQPSDWLEGIGYTLDVERREIMLRRNLGLTKLYNLVNDPDITDAADPDVARLRAIHVELDEAVIDAYGWSDISLDHGFHTYRQMERWTLSPVARVELLDRLLEENHRRAAEQSAVDPKKTTKGRKTNVVSRQVEVLFP